MFLLSQYRKCMKLPRNFALSVKVWSMMNIFNIKAGLQSWPIWRIAQIHTKSCFSNLKVLFKLSAVCRRHQVETYSVCLPLKWIRSSFKNNLCSFSLVLVMVILFLLGTVFIVIEVLVLKTFVMTFMNCKI